MEWEYGECGSGESGSSVLPNFHISILPTFIIYRWIGKRMRPRLDIAVPLLTLLISFFPDSAFPWGAEGHKLIVVKAVEVLPPEISPLFNARIPELKRLSVEPDELWKDPKQWAGHPEWKSRSSWHFLDLDLFHFRYPFDEFPRTRAGADSLYDRADAFMDGRGIAGYLPWTIEDFFYAIVHAWKEGDLDGVIRNSGLLSHFAGDASMPLHLTRNYKGQYSGNIIFKVRWGDKGYPDRSIHERFELSLVNLNISRYREAIRITDADRKPLGHPLSSAFDFILGSYFHLDRIIAADKIIMKSLNIHPQEKNTFDANRRTYYKALDEQVGLLAVERLEAGAVYLGNLWYSAWIEAGKPTFPEAGSWGK